MIFLSSKEIAQKWGVDQSFVLRLAREGRIQDARHLGKSWMIPATAEKPADGRNIRRASTASHGNDFRFPLYVNFEEQYYYPALSDDEKSLRKAQLAFQKCLFDEARSLLRSLCSDSQNRYVRLSAMYHLLYVLIFDNSPEYEKLLSKMIAELSEDFPFKPEMTLLRYGFDADSLHYQSILEEFFVSPDYVYHPSAYYTAVLVSLIPIENGDYSLLKNLRYETYELLCQQMERDGYYLEAQKLHYLLSVVYQLKNDNNKMKAHIKHGLIIARDHNLYFSPALYGSWYPKSTQQVLEEEFPPDFAHKIMETAQLFRKKWNTFEKNRQKTIYITLLSSKELEFAYLANQGYTGREIAHTMKISEKTVSKIYCDIYTKLGVTNKKELIELINATHDACPHPDL